MLSLSGGCLGQTRLVLFIESLTSVVSVTSKTSSAKTLWFILQARDLLLHA